ncbi:hypothetical protein C6Q14_08515 [Burkholderia ambifaria]|nr:hypothetical protein C6Q14_08515 [Burkholderia ambifaria]
MEKSLSLSEGGIIAIKMEELIAMSMYLRVEGKYLRVSSLLRMVQVKQIKMIDDAVYPYSGECALKFNLTTSWKFAENMKI